MRAIGCFALTPTLTPTDANVCELWWTAVA